MVETNTPTVSVCYQWLRHKAKVEVNFFAFVSGTPRRVIFFVYEK